MTKQRFSIVEAAGQYRLVAEWLLSVLTCTEETAGEISLQRSADEQIILQLQITPISEQGNRSALVFLQDVTPQQNTATERRPEEKSVTGARMPRPPEWRAERGWDQVTPDLQPLSPTQVIEWVAGVAHEIRNPLSAIGNCIEILDKQLDLQGDSKELVAIALSECERLDRVLSNLLSFARCSEPLLQPVNVHELVERVLTTLQYDTRFPPAMNVVRDFRAPLQQVLWIDRDQISQVLWNLLINAIQAVPRDNAIRVTTCLEEDDWFCLSVQDKGVGMSPEVMQRVLQPFFTTKTSGTGLGLAMVQQIVRKHGGHVRLRSEEGQGTTVTICLPLRDNAPIP